MHPNQAPMPPGSRPVPPVQAPYLAQTAPPFRAQSAPVRQPPGAASASAPAPVPPVSGTQSTPPAVPIPPRPQPDVDPRNPQFREFPIPVSTTGDLPGHKVGRVLGIVFGVATRPRDLAHNPDMAYITVLARQDAVAAMVKQAGEAGADGVIGLTFDGGKLSDGVSEVTAYGTAVSVVD